MKKYIQYQVTDVNKTLVNVVSTECFILLERIQLRQITILLFVLIFGLNDKDFYFLSFNYY